MKPSFLPGLRLGLLIFCAGFLVFASTRVVRHQAKDPARDGVGDWGVYYRAGKAMRLHRPIYTTEHGPMLTFKNLPAVALMLAPLSALPIGLMRWLWLAGDVACLAIAFRLAGRVVFDKTTPTQIRFWLIAGAVGLSAHYFLDEFFSGSIAIYVFVLSVAAFVWAYEGKGVAAGTALGLGIVLKIVPLAFVPWLLCCRRRWTSFTALVVTLIALTLAPALWTGWQGNIFLLRQWPVHLANTQDHEQDYRRQNQGIYAMLARFLSPTEHHVNIADLNSRTIKAIGLGTSAALAAAIYGWVFFDMRRGRLNAGQALSLLLLFMTVCNPLAWRYNYVAVAVPYLFVLHALWRGTRRAGTVIGLVAASYLLHWAPDAMQVLSARLWGAVALAIAVCLCAKVEDQGDEIVAPAFPMSVPKPLKNSAENA